MKRMEYTMGAGIMVVCGKRTLILKRNHYKKDPFGGYWNFPGGSSEKGETSYQTAVRETEEEIGVSIPYIKVKDHVESKYYTMYIGEVNLQFKPLLDNEHIDYRWIEIDKVKSIENFHPKDKRCFEKYMMKKERHHT